MKNIKNILQNLALSTLVAAITITSTNVFAQTETRLPQEAINSYNEISLVNVKTGELTNDLLLGDSFLDENTYRLNLHADFTGGELQEVIDATDKKQRVSVMNNIKRAKFIITKPDGSKIEKDAVKEFTPEQNGYKATNAFFTDLTRSEIEFGQTYKLEVVDMNKNNEVIGTVNLKIPEKEYQPQPKWKN